MRKRSNWICVATYRFSPSSPKRPYFFHAVLDFSRVEKLAPSLRGVREIAVHECGEQDEGEEAEGPALDEVCAMSAEVGASGGHEWVGSLVSNM
jgi:hypothetical protein